MKLILIQPPVQDFYDTDVRLQPIGLAYLKAAIRRHLPHIEVKILDFHHGWGRRTLPVPQELAYLKRYYAWQDRSPFSTFHAYYHFGAGFDVIADEVACERPDLVGISSLFSPYYREVLATAAAIKKQCDVPVLLGGSHISAMPEFMLAQEGVDFIIRGEGERPMVAFLQAWQNGRDWSRIPNLGYKENGRLMLNGIQDNDEMDALAVPDLSDLDPSRYHFGRKPMSFLITSRSCPHRCSFCSVHQTFGVRYRRHSIDRVMEEIHTRYREGIRVLDFEDDNLTYFREEMKTLCRRLIDEFPPGELECLAMNGISYLSLDDELLELMKKAGFTHLNLALVSSDTTVRETTKRPHTVEKFVSVVEKGFALGFRIVAYQILGLPNESLDSMIQTLTFLAAQPVLIGSSPFYLTPNSPIARDFPPPTPCDVFRARLTAMAIETDACSRDDLFTLFVTTRILDFLKSIPLSQEAIEWEEGMASLAARSERDRQGVRLLKNLLAGQGLAAWTPQGDRPIEGFKSDLFLKVWTRLEALRTQHGVSLDLPRLEDLPHSILLTSSAKTA